MGQISEIVHSERCGWFVIVRILYVLGYDSHSDFCVNWDEEILCATCPLDNTRSPLYTQSKNINKKK